MFGRRISVFGGLGKTFALIPVCRLSFFGLSPAPDFNHHVGRSWLSGVS